jgi:hypothetical protein
VQQSATRAVTQRACRAGLQSYSIAAHLGRGAQALTGFLIGSEFSGDEEALGDEVLDEDVLALA